MVMNMNVENYCMVNKATNACDNVTVWDGNPDTWTPPDNYLMLVQTTTPTKVWLEDHTTGEWALAAVMGQGQIGFTWDGNYLITNEPKPTTPITPVQPAVAGAQTL